MRVRHRPNERTPPCCKPWGRLLFHMWRDGSKLPTPMMKLTTQSWHSLSAILGFFDYFRKQAALCGVPGAQLFGLPFELTLTEVEPGEADQVSRAAYDAARSDPSLPDWPGRSCSTAADAAAPSRYSMHPSRTRRAARRPLDDRARPAKGRSHELLPADDAKTGQRSLPAGRRPPRRNRPAFREHFRVGIAAHECLAAIGVQCHRLMRQPELGEMLAASQQIVRSLVTTGRQFEGVAEPPMPMEDARAGEKAGGGLCDRRAHDMEPQR